MFRLGLIVAIAAVGLGIAPGAAIADATMDFESPVIADCTRAGDHFAGVRFEPYSVPGLGSSDVIVRQSATAHSGVQYVESPTCSTEFSAPGLRMQLDATRAGVTLFARTPDTGFNPRVQLRAFDAGGSRVDTNGDAYVALTGGTSGWRQLAASTAGDARTIARVDLVLESPQIFQGLRLDVDDVVLRDGGGAAPQPDFTVGPAPRLVVQQGRSQSVVVPVSRINGAANDYSATVTGAPAGVSASAAINAEGNARVDASATLLATDTNAGSLTVTVTPRSAAAGHAPRSIVVPLVITSQLPTVTIDEPVEGTRLERVPSSLAVRGTFRSPRGGPATPTGFCAAVTQAASPPPSAPTSCAAAQSSNVTGGYRIVLGTGLRRGDNFITVFARDASGYVGSATRLLRIVNAASGIDLRITGMEVGQGVQRYTTAGGMALPAPTGTTTRAYRGVQLVSRRAAFVRVYATTNRAARSDGTTPNVTARLRVTRDGVQVPGSPFLPLGGPRNIEVGGAAATNADRADASRGYMFELPPDVTDHGPLTLEPVINDEINPIAECGTCAANNRMRLTDLRFRPMHTLHIYPLRITDDFNGHHAPTRDFVSVFTQARMAFPFPIALHSWGADIDVTADQMTADREIRRWWTDHPLPSQSDRPPRNEDWIIHWVGSWERDHGSPGGETIGVGRGSFAGMTSAPTLFCCSPLRVERFALVEQDRPLTSVAHEFGHIRGLPHADHGAQPPSCGGGLRGETGDDEFPDAMGTLVGFGFRPDTRTVLPAYDPVTGGAANFDFMSYCAGDNNSWLSSRYWDRLVDGQADGEAARATLAARAGGPGLAVTVRLGLDDSDATITDVQPVSSGSQASAGGSGYELAVLDDAGRVLSSTRVRVATVHGDGPDPTVERQAIAVVPAGNSAAVVQLRKDGAVLAARKASAHAPSVQLVAPRPGRSVGSRGSLVVRWRADDEDGDALQVSLDEAAGPHAPFRLVAGGLRGGVAKIPVAVLAPARHGRLRLRVSDGFRETAAVVRRIRIAPRPPQVSIAAPSGRRRVRADAILSLEGQATDAANRMVSARRLTWSVGGRRLCRGSTVDLSGLRPGKRTVTLTARDAAGLRGHAHLQVVVLPVKPRLLSLRATKRLPRSARSLRLDVASSVAGRVRVSGPGARGAGPVGRTRRGVRVKVVPGRSTLRLRLVLTGGGGRSTAKLSVPRAKGRSRR